MYKIVKMLYIPILAAFSILIISCTEKAGNEDMTMKSGIGIDLANLDTTVKPGDNFFRYANGSWIDKNPIPGDYSRYGAFEILQDKNLDNLKTIFEEAANSKDSKPGSKMQKIGDFYSSGMNSEQIEKDGLKFVNPMIAKIDEAKTIEDIQRIIAWLHTYQIAPLFYFYSAQDEKNSERVISNLYQGGLGLPDRDYYIENDDRSKEIRKQYKDHLIKMFVLMGKSEAHAMSSMETILKLETRLAKASRSRVDLRDPQKNYNKLTVSDLMKSNPNFAWDKYFVNIGAENISEINVGQPEFYIEINKMMTDISVDNWKEYLKWNVINELANYLIDDFVNQNFAFFGKVLSGSKELKPRWKRVLSTTSGGLGELVGQLYVEKYFPPAAKERMLELVNNLKIALEQHIKNLEWMGAGTKKEALEKLARMNVKIGYPDKWIDYSKLDITPESYVNNVLASRNFKWNLELEKIGKPVDRGEWHMTPQTVNAYYSPTMNEIVFPAAILQYPFFILDADDAVNYGAIGVVIGHEMTHGFDDQGRQYDKEGNLRDWWTEDDAKLFNEKVEPLIHQYNAFEALESQYVNGKLTLGENIADVGGLTVALTALKKSFEGKQEPKDIDGLTWLQRYYLSYAQVWRQNIRQEELAQRLKTDVHSPGEFRTIGATANAPEFYEAFNVTKDQKYYIPKEKRAVIW